MEIWDALWVRRIRESCVRKDVWVCSNCSHQFKKMTTVVGHSTACPSCGCRLVLNYKNKL
jgi:DNA-directed RNA polymerase subunit RPC12/RpoP